MSDEPVRPDTGNSTAASTASASCASNDPTVPGPTGPASPNGAATAPPAASAGDSPAGKAPESPVPSLDPVRRLRWMEAWAAKNGLTLDLDGEIGFGRDAVTVTNRDGTCPDYGDPYEGDDGDVWTPRDAYHKYQCVAVLGKGEEAELQMYEWLRWFDDNGYVCVEAPSHPNTIGAMLGHKGCRMVKR